eukprot:gene3349-3672_t
MLRVLQRPLGKSFLGCRPLSNNVLKVNVGVPTQTNSILITNLPNTVTKDTLSKAFKDIRHKRFELQPGCSLHFAHEEDALKASAVLKEKAKLVVDKVTTFLPSVTIDALPTTTTQEDLLSTFAAFRPVVADLRPYSSASIYLGTKEVKDIPANTATVTYRLSEATSPALMLRNLRHLTEQQVKALLESENGIKRISFKRTSSEGFLESAVIYFEKETQAIATLRRVKDIFVDGRKVYAVYRNLVEPIAVLSAVPEGVTVEDVRTLFEGHGVETLSRAGKDYQVVFRDIDARQVAMDSLHEQKWRGEIISLKPLAPQVLHIEGADVASVTATTLPQLYPSAAAAGGVSYSSGVRATIAFRSHSEAVQALHAYQLQKVTLASGLGATRSERPIATLEAQGLKAEESVSKLLKLLPQQGKEVLRDDRVALVKLARHALIVPTLKKVRAMEIDGHKVRAERFLPNTPSSSSTTAYDEKGPAEQFDELAQALMQDTALEQNPAERYSILRNEFERLIYTLQTRRSSWFEDGDNSLPPALKKEATKLLSELPPLDVTVREDDDDDDEEEEGEKKPLTLKEEEVQKREQIMNRLFEIFLQSKDNLRFTKDFEQLALLSRGTGEAQGEESRLLHWTSFDPEGDEEVEELYQKVLQAEKAAEQQRAKEIYGIDTSVEEEFEKKDLAEGLGDDLLDLSGLTDDQAMKKLLEFDEKDKKKNKKGGKKNELDAEEEEKRQQLILEESKKLDKALARLDLESKLMIEDDDGDLNEISMDGPELIDDNGHAWSGVIIDTDMTQKTMPGQRIGTFRALVCVGNCKGTAGMGMGKGAGAREAIEAAFRDALRNLIHVDLYDNFGLARDLHGKHNSCHAYIRATSAERLFVGSNLAEEVLACFGISSASVKLVGRRTPYSQTRAIFDALSRHQNIDEYAKMTGKRYLTLKWARDQHGL